MISSRFPASFDKLALLFLTRPTSFPNNKKGLPVGPGKPGGVVITVLFNRCQPRILYQLHDVVAYSDGECDCDLLFPLLKAVKGRDEETIWVQMMIGSYEGPSPPGLRGLLRAWPAWNAGAPAGKKTS